MNEKDGLYESPEKLDGKNMPETNEHKKQKKSYSVNSRNYMKQD